MKFKKIQKDLKQNLKENRYRHTMGVVRTAKRLAAIHGESIPRARMAALLHDCAKEIGDDKKIAMCREYGFPVNDTEQQNPSLLHAKCGAIVAEYRYGITDARILHAILVHTTGVPQMNRLDKIIFIADYIEPNRDKAPHLKALRKLAGKDLDLTVYRILEDTVRYLNRRNAQAMDPATEKAYHYYLRLCKGGKHHERNIQKNGKDRISRTE